MVTEQLKQAYEAAQKLSPKDQDMLAKKILEEIDEQEWHEIIAHPSVMNEIVELARQAREEHAAGLSEEGGFDCL